MSIFVGRVVQFSRRAVLGDSAQFLCETLWCSVSVPLKWPALLYWLRCEGDAHLCLCARRCCPGGICLPLKDGTVAALGWCSCCAASCAITVLRVIKIAVALAWSCWSFNAIVFCCFFLLWGTPLQLRE